MEQHSWLFHSKCMICGKEELNTPQTYLCDDCWKKKFIYDKGDKMDKEQAFIEAFKPEEMNTMSKLKFGGTSLEEIKQKTQEVGRKDDTSKLRWDLLDPDFPEGIVKILTFGAKKYADNNWRKLKDNGGTDRCYAALMRHLTEWRKGNKVDPETGLSHLYHAACNLYFLEWFDKESK